MKTRASTCILIARSWSSSIFLPLILLQLRNNILPNLFHTIRIMFHRFHVWRLRHSAPWGKMWIIHRRLFRWYLLSQVAFWHLRLHQVYYLEDILPKSFKKHGIRIRYSQSLRNTTTRQKLQIRVNFICILDELHNLKQIVFTNKSCVW